MRLWSYSLLRAVPLRIPVRGDQLVHIAGTAADRAMRAEYGAAAGAHAIPARTAEQLATCRRAAAGTPARLGRR
ncbi:hypothetical protein LWC35_06090 [Pseudonocardia kujensis]|uniref:hypothetical protein n=1 Tax=Pseudonocardia kujensis TaxID=1128675 RepID=UPI001E2974EB|nr:hypothetical protein [Pseudonocardia kujensis]MCE0762481.1 hypothetical protein [Pseudonocardia kujensis]